MKEMINTKAKKILLPFFSIVALFAIFVLIQPYILKIVFGEETKTLYVSLSDLDVSTEKNSDGYNQIVYKYGNKKIPLSEDNNTHANPVSSENYVVWMSQVDGLWQIFLHNVSTEKTTQLTRVGNNVNPDVSAGKVVWEKQVDGVWQIMLFDGVRILQITDSVYPSQSPKIDGDFVVYRQMHEEGGTWKVHLYKMASQRDVILTVDDGGLNVDIEDGYVSWDSMNGRFLGSYIYDIANDSINVSNSEVAGASISSFDEQAYKEFSETVEKDVSAGTLENPVQFNNEDILSEINLE